MAEKKPDTSVADRQREAKRKWAAAKAQEGRDVGGIPPILNPERYESCRYNLRLFCETYNPEAFYHGWSDAHLEAIARIEEAVLTGALYAFAMPRGSGKTTLSRMATLWAASYAHRKYVYIIGANQGKAEDSLEALKVWMRFLPIYAEDFPHVAAPAIALNGIANRASGQTCNGDSTMIAWGKHKVVLPTVHDPGDKELMAETSGIIIASSGLTGDGIRGSLHTTTTGELVRPDLVLLDDPQTDESAASPSQNEKRERLIAGAVLGMAGPGKSISAVMPCTVIQRDDMVDRLLNREKHPLWRGTRSKMLTSMPTNMAAWEPYFDLYDECAIADPPNYEPANEYYIKHRKKLDEGAEPSWNDRHMETEISAVQSAMHLYHRDRPAFYSEYQNEPEEAEAARAALRPADVLAKTVGIKQGEVPLDAEHVTAFIDVQKKCLWYTIVAWSDAFGGHVVDYGAWPEQRRQYYTLSEIRSTLQRKHPKMSLEGQLFAGMKDLVDNLLARSFHRPDGSSLSMGLIMIDANWGESTSVVKKLCREHGDRRLLAAHGTAYGPDKKPMLEYKVRKGERKGWNWIINASGREGRHVRYDGNQFKSLVASRFRAGVGEAETLTIYKGDEHRHRMLAEQMASEYPVETSALGRTVDVWKLKPNRDNHLFDCVVGAAVGASILGVKALGHEVKTRARARKKATARF